MTLLAGATGAGYSDDVVSVGLSTGSFPQETCFIIENDVSEWSSTGCIDSFLLETGLAYGAFEAKDGSIEVVGLVPDDVATVAIGGTVISVKNNVWHYSGHQGENLSFTVRSADGTLSVSVS